MVLSGHQVLLMLYIKGFCLSDDHGDGDGDSDGNDCFYGINGCHFG